MKTNIKKKYTMINGINISSRVETKLRNFVELLQFKSQQFGFKKDVVVNSDVELERVIEYREEYREKTYNHFISICVEEFGFETWKEGLLRFACSEYKDNNGNFWIAINEKDEVVGTIGLKNIDNETGELKVFYLNKEYRGKGLAKKLFNTCMSFIEEKDYKIIVLSTFERFDRAISFYKKNGFKEVEKVGEISTYKYIVEKNTVEAEDDLIGENVLEYNVS